MGASAVEHDLGADDVGAHEGTRIGDRAIDMALGGQMHHRLGLVLHLVQDLGHEVLTLDAMTYAANPISLQPLADEPRHRLEQTWLSAARCITASGLKSA
jgi:hypothetical protein